MTITHTEENKLDYIAYKQNRLTQLLKKLDVLKKEIRAEFFQEADEHYEKSHWLLPMTSWQVPIEFFQKTGLSYDEFIKTRFPQWDVTIHEGEDEVVFILKKKKQYMPWSYVNGEYEISRSVAELTPEIDWESMEKVDPEFFEKFSKPITNYELDVESFNAYMNTHPEFSGTSFLTIYTKHKAPTLRVLSKKKEEK